jgi:hypothetical protein
VAVEGVHGAAEQGHRGGGIARGAHDHGQIVGEVLRRLRDRQVDERPRLLPELDVPRVARHADDRHAGVAARDPLADGAVRPVATRHGLVDDRDGRGAAPVLLAEVPARAQRHAEDAEVAGRDEHEAHRILARRVGAGRREGHHRLVLVAGERQEPGERRGAHARVRRQPLEQRVVERGGARAVVALQPRVDERHRDALGVVAGLGAERRAQAAHEESRPGEQHQAERELRDDERAAEPRASLRLGAGLQHADDVRPRRLHRRHEPEEQHGDQRQHDRREHHAPADVGAERGQVDSAGEREGGEEPPAEHADGEPGDAAQDGEGEALREQLARDPAASGAEREAHRELRWRRAARASMSPARLAQAMSSVSATTAASTSTKPSAPGPPSPSAAALASAGSTRSVLCPPGGPPGSASSCARTNASSRARACAGVWPGRSRATALIQPHSALMRSSRVNEPTAVSGQALIGSHRSGADGQARAAELGRRHADHGERRPVEPHRAAEHRRVPAELAPPQPVAQHRRPARARPAGPRRR